LYVSGVPNAALYGATKAFVRSFCAGIRSELRPAGVSVTCLLPGATDTGFATAGRANPKFSCVDGIGICMGLRFTRRQRDVPSAGCHRHGLCYRRFVIIESVESRIRPKGGFRSTPQVNSEP